MKMLQINCDVNYLVTDTFLKAHKTDKKALRDPFHYLKFDAFKKVELDKSVCILFKRGVCRLVRNLVRKLKMH